jgi:hypothetical protein
MVQFRGDKRFSSEEMTVSVLLCVMFGSVQTMSEDALYTKKILLVFANHLVRNSYS